MTKPSNQYELRGLQHICAISACTYPEGECQRVCLIPHRMDRVDSRSLPPSRVVSVPGHIEQRKRITVDVPIEPPSRLRMALNTYAIFRRANRPRREALGHAWRAFKSL